MPRHSKPLPGKETNYDKSKDIIKVYINTLQFSCEEEDEQD